MEVDQEGKFDFGVSFKSQMPMFEDLQLTVRNDKLNDQYKPHIVVQWASDKKIEMSGTFSWSSTYKVNIDLNTPFDRYVAKLSVLPFTSGTVNSICRYSSHTVSWTVIYS